MMQLEDRFEKTSSQLNEILKFTQEVHKEILPIIGKKDGEILNAGKSRIPNKFDKIVMSPEDSLNYYSRDFSSSEEIIKNSKPATEVRKRGGRKPISTKVFIHSRK